MPTPVFDTPKPSFGPPEPEPQQEISRISETNEKAWREVVQSHVLSYRSAPILPGFVQVDVHLPTPQLNAPKTSIDPPELQQEKMCISETDEKASREVVQSDGLPEIPAPAISENLVQAEARLLRPRGNASKTRTDQPESSPSEKKSRKMPRWKPADIDKLVRLCDDRNNTWQYISSQFKGRSAGACFMRWKQSKRDAERGKERETERNRRRIE